MSTLLSGKVAHLEKESDGHGPHDPLVEVEHERHPELDDDWSPCQWVDQGRIGLTLTCHIQEPSLPSTLDFKCMKGCSDPRNNPW
jgi:hypothetical protein